MSSTLPCWFFQQPQSQDEPHRKDDKIQRPQAIQVRDLLLELEDIGCIKIPAMQT